MAVTKPRHIVIHAICTYQKKRSRSRKEMPKGPNQGGRKRTRKCSREQGKGTRPRAVARPISDTSDPERPQRNKNETRYSKIVITVDRESMHSFSQRYSIQRSEARIVCHRALSFRTTSNVQQKKTYSATGYATTDESRCADYDKTHEDIR